MLVATILVGNIHSLNKGSHIVSRSLQTGEMSLVLRMVPKNVHCSPLRATFPKLLQLKENNLRSAICFDSLSLQQWNIGDNYLMLHLLCIFFFMKTLK